MQFKGVKVWLIVLACLVTFGLLIGGNYYYKKLKIDQPLFKLYNNITEVEKYEVKEESNTTQILLTVKETPNLKNLYLELQEGTSSVMGTRAFEITIKDNRSKELGEIFDNNQLIIYEALMNGNFTEMANSFNQAAEVQGAKVRIFMDNKKMYIQLSKGEYYLYEIIDWQNFNLRAAGIGSDKSDQGS